MSHSRSLHSQHLVNIHFRKLWMFSTLAFPCGWNGLENNLLIPSSLHASLGTLFLNSVPLSLIMATLPPLLANIQDK